MCGLGKGLGENMEQGLTDGTCSMYGGFLCAEVFEEQKNDSSGNEVSIPPRKRLRIYGIAQEEHEKHEKRPDPRNDFKNLFSCFFTHFVSECVFRFPLSAFSFQYVSAALLCFP